MGRLWQLVKASANTRFLYDGDELVGEYDGSGALLRRHVHGQGVDDPVKSYLSGEERTVSIRLGHANGQSC